MQAVADACASYRSDSADASYCEATAKQCFIWQGVTGNEARLRRMKHRCAVWNEALTGFIFFLPKFWQKKWRLEILSYPAILNCILNLKTQNLAVKWNSENRFTFRQKNSEYAIRKQKKIGKNGKNLSHISDISLGKFVANKRKSQIEIRFANGILCWWCLILNFI